MTRKAKIVFIIVMTGLGAFLGLILELMVQYFQKINHDPLIVVLLPTALLFISSLLSIGILDRKKP